MESLKLGILGLDSTHFDAFYKIIKSTKIQLDIFYLFDESNKVKKTRVSEYPELKIFFNNDPDKCDCFMVLNRFGEDHLKAFERIVSFGKPTFIDKPISNNFQNASKIFKLAKDHNTPITSHSPLEFSDEFYEAQSIYKEIITSKQKTAIIFSGPSECNDLGDDPRLKNALFYGIHLSEMLSSLISEKAIDKIEKISNTNDQRTTISFKNGEVSFFIDLYSEGSEFYNITFYNNIMGHKSIDIKLDGSYYDKFVSHLIGFFQQRAHIKPSKKSLNAMKILNEAI